MIDVTQRKRSERALAASEARKDAILRAALDCVVIVDHEGLIVEVNPATEETFGWTRAEAIGQAVPRARRRARASRRARRRARDRHARCSARASRSTRFARDQRSFPAELAITRVDVPGPLLFAVSLRDVTKRHQREERLRQAEAKYRTLVEQLPLATYVNARACPCRRRYMSPQIEPMLGYPGLRLAERPGFFLTRVAPRRSRARASPR